MKKARRAGGPYLLFYAIIIPLCEVTYNDMFPGVYVIFGNSPLPKSHFSGSGFRILSRRIRYFLTFATLGFHPHLEQFE